MELIIEKNTFNDYYLPYLDFTARNEIFFGGSSSGKSRFIAQRMVVDIIKNERNFIVVRKTRATLKKSCLQEITQVLSSWKIIKYFDINKTDLTIIYRPTQRMIALFGLDDVEKLKSIVPIIGVFTDIVAEEATEIDEQDIKQLDRRLRGKSNTKKRTTYIFNPILKTHWIYKRFFQGVFGDNDQKYQDENILILKSTYKNNKFLAQDDIDLLENETDKYWKDVYTHGKWGVLGNTVFKNYTIADIKNDPIFSTFDNIKIGLDFGFSNDPTAIVKLYYYRAKRLIYIFDEYSCLGKTNSEISDDIQYLVGQHTVVADSAEPKSIKELNGYNIRIKGAKKGKDSIKFGIQWLQQQTIIIDKSCSGTIDNFEAYCWKKDKSGSSTSEPEDKNNDFIDALRYAMEDDMTSSLLKITVGYR